MSKPRRGKPLTPEQVRQQQALLRALYLPQNRQPAKPAPERKA